MLFAETSAIVTAYAADEADHPRMLAVLFGDQGPVLASELVRLEFAAAMAAAARAGRIDDAAPVIARLDADCAEGPIRLLALRGGSVLDRAARLVREYRLRSLDAIHLAVALEDARPLAHPEPITFLTRDQRQADAARSLGFLVA